MLESAEVPAGREGLIIPGTVAQIMAGQETEGEGFKDIASK